ncbi:DUF7507 domain-containing protein [Microbacterium sp. ASV49]|uniref:Gram-positive cocci surface proteins LPxTG domain-containing protein n=1 Tax=Microbacterium candidum TaxID=3041922 RepID=A0ABT7MUD5_9MICO|nr:hypothetical protein [Microbacterium sp. ASV49]MDL9978070.1 hypothetical protein [Microbacterium sp. ASV49]
MAMIEYARTRRAASEWAKKRSRLRLRRLVAAVVAPLTVLALILGTAAPASAAGSAQLTVSVVAVNASTGTPITSLAPGAYPGLTQKIAFRVDFSCVSANCDNATVKFDPTALDPNYNYYRLLTKSGFTPPLSGGTLSGSDTAGWTVSLNDLAAGQSGQFTLEYQTGASGCWDWNVGRDGQYTNCPVVNFPNGFPITQTVRGNADTASGEKVATSATVQWTIPTPSPTVAYGDMYDANGTHIPAGGTLSTDTDYRFNVNFASGCVWGRVTAYLVVDPLPDICASGYTVTQQLPIGAVYVPSSGDGSPTVSGTWATGQILTWTGPAWSKPGANTSAIGWGAANGFDSYTGAVPRVITIKFPRANLAPFPAQECNYSTTTNGPVANATATYISMPGTPGDVRTANQPANSGYVIRCVDPFPRALMDPKQSTYDGAQRPVTADATVVIPTTGENDKQWNVTVANTANIWGVAVVTDNTLDLPDLPVYQITTSATGSTIRWTATDGTTTVSGTSTDTANAPVGFHFVTSTVTSPRLAPPNQLPEQTYRTNFTVSYKYRVTPGATNPTLRRINTASAVMQWPDYPQFPDTQLGPTSGAVTLIAPFGKIDTWKGAWGSGSNTTDQPHPPTTTDATIPATGAPAQQFYWNVYVGNFGNAPATATVTDPNLDFLGVSTVRIIPYIRYGWNGGYVQVQANIQYKLDDGTTGTVTSADWWAPAGRRIVSATVTSVPQVTGGSTFPTDTNYNAFVVTFWGSISDAAVPDSRFTNNATGSLNYGTTSLGTLTKDTAHTIHLVGQAQTMTATMRAPAISDGASQATTASNVTFTVCGATANVPLNRDMTPEYVFMAPVGWNITPGSASFPAGSVPAGVTFAYNTVTVAGVPRQVAVATWPAGTSWGKNTNLPCMSVIARPTSAVPAGTQSVARGFLTNTANVIAGDVFSNQFLDAPDIDSNPATLRFSESTPPTVVPVAAVAAMQVLKEICQPDATQADGCKWYADPNNRVGVPPNSTSIKYRISVINTGNTNLSDVVGYDVLPYPGDTGTSDATAGDQRGSTFDETVQSVTTPTNGAVAAFSTSTQPCRAEVSSLTPPACTDDWNNITSTGAQAIRLSRAGVLAPGTSFSMGYTAAVNNAPGFGAVACNSFAVKAVGLSLVSEPAPVCASIEETDLQITAGTPQLQDGRPGVLPWTVVNNGGAPSTTGEAAFKIPAGLQVTSFTPTGWVCTAVDGSGNPVYGTATGPATLTCTPKSPLLLGVPQAINLAVQPTTTSRLTIPAHVSGRMFDQNPANNDAIEQVTPTPPAAGIALTKDDGVTTAKPGDTLTYTITGTNTLDFETLVAPTLKDTLPGGVQYVSSSNGGALSNGVVTWTLPDMPGGGTVTRTVTVKVLTTIAMATLTNSATVSAPDPAFAGTTLSAVATDVDNVVTNPKLTLVKSSSTPTFAAVDDVVTYTFSSQNTGDVTLHDVAISDPLPGLSTVKYGIWPGGAGTDGVLAPGQTITATATYKITQGDLDATKVDNIATVTGSTPGGVNDVTATGHREVTSTAAPSISLVKSTSSVVAKAGDPVVYTFLVTNTGPLTLKTVGIVDAMKGLSDIVFGNWPGQDKMLAPGQSVSATATYKATQADVDAGTIVNTATADGTTSAGVDVTSAKVVVPLSIARTAGITLDKTATYGIGQTGKAGEKINYVFTATNTGNTTLTAVTIADPLPGLSKIAYGDWPDRTAGLLLPGQSVTATASYTVTQADVDGLKGVTNTATVTSMAPNGASPSATSTKHMDTPATSGIQLVKTADRGTGVPKVGDVVTYHFAATNLGVVTLTGVTIKDPMVGLSKIRYGTWPDGEVGTLLPGSTITATATYTLTQADVDASKVVNTATVVGDPSAGDPVTSNATVTRVLPGDAKLAFHKAGSIAQGAWKTGETVTYGFIVGNTGNVTLSNVVITDPLPGLTTITYQWPGKDGVLAPGQTATATATYKLTAADIAKLSLANTATATSDRAPAVTDSVTLTGPADPPPGLPPTGGTISILPIAAGSLLLGGGLLLVLVTRRRRTRKN